ncbi:MAG: chemotaxis protein CheV [Gammaproteobacteria bacterium]|jgi:two-component system chemotaxis response regulator CheV
MANLLQDVDRRTQIVGENRLELLLFRLRGEQTYGINVFKVQEVIQCPKLTHVPKSNKIVRGIANMRGKTIPVVDLGMALNLPPIDDQDNAYVIIADYNRSVQGFLVTGVDRIVNMHWDQILPPPKGSGGGHYLTAVTNVDDKIVEIIDLEKVLHQIVGVDTTVSQEVVENVEEHSPTLKTVLVADDSTVARKHIKRTLDQIGINCVLVKDGKEALDYLENLASEQGEDVNKDLSVVVSDIEMPNMDGYTLTTMIRQNPKLKDLHVILHTSLSGIFNHAMVEKVGANEFVPKFNANDLANAIIAVVDRPVTDHAA